MALELDIDFVSGYAKDSQNYCEWWGGGKRRAKGRLYAAKLRKAWGIGYGSGGLEEIPYGLVRDSSSEYYIHCEDVEEIYHQSSEQYDDAVDRFNSCGSFAKRCKCRGVIDKAKWVEIRDWADGARKSQSDSLGYNSCDEEEDQEAVDNILSQAQAMLDGREDAGLPNSVILSLIGAGTIGLIFLMLKVTK